MSGLRIGNLPAVGPNWSNPFTATFEFKTYIHTAFDRTEVRDALRAEPRLSLSYSGYLRRDDAHRHLGDLALKQSGAFSVPLPWREVEIVSIDLGIIEVGVVPFWLVDGASIVLKSEIGQQTATVLSMTGNYITVSPAISASLLLGAGDRISPYFDCRMKDKVNYTAVTDDLWEGEFTFDADPGSNIIAFDGATPAQIDGIDVLDLPANWRPAPTLDFEVMRRMFDPGIGRIYSDDPVGFHSRAIGVSLGPVTREEAERVLAFFYRQRGKRGEFWWDTGLSDASWVAGGATGASTVTVAGRSVYDTYVQANRLYRRLLVSNGSAETATLAVGSVALNGNLDTVVTFSSPLPFSVGADTRFSWFHKWRWATDILDVRWVTDSFAEIDTTFVTVPEAGV